MEFFEYLFLCRKRRTSLLTPLHYVAYGMEIRSAREDIPEYNVHIRNHMRMFVLSVAFPPTSKLSSASVVDRVTQHLFEKFTLTRIEWNIELGDDCGRCILLAYRNMPGMYWIQKNKYLLRTFELRILCVSASSSSSDEGLVLKNVFGGPYETVYTQKP